MKNANFSLQRFAACFGAAVLLALLASPVRAGDVGFFFEIPSKPSPPEIVNVSNSTTVTGGEIITVYASIKGADQYELCCDPSGNAGYGPNAMCVSECEPDCDFSNCSMTDFYEKLDTRIDPNPTCIPSDVDPDGLDRTACSGKANPVVHYYYDGDPSTGGSEVMTYDSDAGSFKADIPISGYSIDSHHLTWYFIAGDNRGNVVTQVPDPGVPPCITLSSWSSDYETPAIDNCSLMSSYNGISGEDCGVLVQGTPSCASSYTVNDPQNDTCGESQEPYPVSLADIRGISAGFGRYDALSGADVVCTKIKLGANPPDVGSSSGPIEIYVMSLYNPDIIDPNPYDMHIPGLYVLTYAPEVYGADTNLGRVLWDGECITNPNTADPLSCKLLTGGGSEERFKIGASGDELVFIVKNALPDGNMIAGDSSESVYAVMTTGNIQLENETPFWTVDSAAAISMVAKNQSITFPYTTVDFPPIPDNPTICKWPDNTIFANGLCAQNDIRPTKNTCSLTIHKSPACSFAGSYNIYHNTENDPYTATEISSITSDLCSTNYFDYDIPGEQLDGHPQYFFLSATNLVGNDETNPASWTWTTCTPEDWIPASAPDQFSCATPAGQENRCECIWNSDTSADPSITGFKLWRDSELITLDPFPAAPGVSTYSLTDFSDQLETGSTYSYAVRAVDAGYNISSETTTTCQPEDLKSPEKVGSLAITLVPSTPEVNLSWNASETDTDIAGYNAYVCHETIPSVSCNSRDDYIRLNSSLISGETELPSSSITETFEEEESYCFWIEACDNCYTEGNCPSNGGAPNCSYFDTMKPYRKCVNMSVLIDCGTPDFPESTTVSPLSEGASCKLEWESVCSGTDGTFDDCTYPYPCELMGYYIMRAEAPAGATDCSGVTIPDNPVTNDRAGTAPVSTSPGFTDTGLTNGTGYCYRVHAYNVSNDFSRGIPPDPVLCIPTRTQSPDMPIMQSMDFTSISCSPSWSEVDDTAAVTYTVHRCDDEPANCMQSDFSAVSEATDITDLTYDDLADTSDTYYTYCITAEDESQNTSPIIDPELSYAAGSSNCAACFPSDKPTSPTNVNFVQNAEKICSNGPYELSVWWTDSSDDNGSGNGYNLYLCDSNYGPASNCSQIAEAVQGGRNSESPYIATNVSVRDSGNYFLAVTYENEAESTPAFSNISILLNEYAQDISDCSTPPVPSYCDTSISFQGAFKQIGLAESEGVYSTTETEIECVQVLVVTDETDPSSAIAARFADSSGNMRKMILMDSWFSSGSPYSIVAKLPAGSFDQPYKPNCKNTDPDSDGYCIVRLLNTTILDGQEITVNINSIPIANGGGYGAEIGNANGDGSVNLFDLAAIKKSMNTTSSDPCYRQWADFNLDGNINLFDLGILKDHMGEQFDTNADDFNPILIESKDPLPAECN